MDWKKLLRWLAVLPSSIGGLVVGGVAVNIFSVIQRWFLGASPDSGWAKIMYYIVSSAVGGGLAIYWGVKVAPSHRKIVALILFSLLMVVSVFVALFALTGDHVFWSIVSAITTVFGAGYVTHSVYTGDQNFL